MAAITIYTSMMCPYCYRAKDLLRAKGADFTEINVAMAPDKRREMIERAGGAATVPQIFIGETHVGGCDDLYALERRGHLDALLAGAS